MKPKGKETAIQGVTGKDLGDVIFPFLIYYLAYLLAAVILTQIVMYVRLRAGDSLQAFLTEQEATVSAVLGGIAMLIGVLPVIPVFRREGQRDGERRAGSGETVRRSGKRERVVFFIRTVVTVLLALSTSIAVNILFSQLHLLERSETYTEVSERQYGVWFPAGLFLYGILSPFVEEIVFRGVIYNRMKRCFTIKQAVILSALLFGVYHGNLVQGLYGFLIGSLIAYTYEKFNGFFFAILFHAAANLAVYTITGSESLYQFVMRPAFGIACVIASAVILAGMQSAK